MGWKEDFTHLLDNDNKFIEAMKLYKDNKPDTIFRYRKGSVQDIETLHNNEIWLSRLNLVNDMFEGTFEVNIENQETSLESLKEEVQNNAIKYMDKMRSRLCIACFCQELTSVPMWSYYSDYHKGFCIEYDIMEFKQFVHPVVYSEQKVVNINNKVSLRDEEKNLTIKDMQWALEKEWRIIEVTKSESDLGKKIIQPKPKGIYLGVESEQKEEVNLENELRNYCMKNGVPLYKMKVDKIKRKLYRHRIM